MIYDETDMGLNPIYEQVMEDINLLHEEMGCPFPDPDAPSKLTTNSSTRMLEYGGDWTTPTGLVWDPEAYEEYGDSAEKITKDAQDQLDRVLTKIDRGPIQNIYRQGKDWEDFAEEALKRVHLFNRYDAVNSLDRILKNKKEEAWK